MPSKTLWGCLLGLLLTAAPVASLSLETRVEEVLCRNFNSREATKHSSSQIYDTKFSGVTWDQENWRIESTNLDQGHYQSRGSIANGYIGINVASVGPFFELDTPVDGDVINGWPLFSRRQTFGTVGGFFNEQPLTEGTNFPWISQYGGESVISGLPHWSGIILDLGGNTYLDATVDSRTISNFKNVYDYKAGVLEWSYTWSPKGHSGFFQISYSLFTNKLYVNQAVVQLQITPSANTQGSVVNVLDGFGAVRTEFVSSGQDGAAIYSAVRPTGISNVTAYVYATLGGNGLDLSSTKLVHKAPYLHSNQSSIAQSASVSFKAGQTVEVVKYVGIASTDAFANPRQIAKEASAKAAAAGYQTSFQAHVKEWATILPDYSVDDFTLPNGSLPSDPFVIQSAITAVTNPYYLLQNTVGENALAAVDNAPVNHHSISVGGLTSDSYAGMVFWDADLWMHPGIVAAHPQSARSITNYRVALYPQAKLNAKTNFEGSQIDTFISPDAAAYPWTSGRYGNCTATGPCWDYEYHLNGDIAISLINDWVSSGDTENFQNVFFPIYNSLATLYADLLDQQGSSWTLKNMTDPDEFANAVDAGGYTMPLIAQTLTYANQFRSQFGEAQNQTWNTMAANVLVIRVNGITLEYTTMNNSVQVKQADVVLDTYPLSYTNNYTSQDSLTDLNYYALKQSNDGPAMTYAIFSAVANQVATSGCPGWTYAQYSYDPYVRAPFFYLSEQLIDDFTQNGGTHPAYPFLTGHGGANQVVLFGFLGLRLLPDGVIHIDPNLPPQVPQVKYRTFYWRGWPIQATSNYTHTTIQRAPNVKPLDTADSRFAHTAIPIHAGPLDDFKVYQLPTSGPVTVPNRATASIKTVAGNIAQCQPVVAWSSYEPGQFPMSVVDGAESTKWQPTSAADWSALTVTLPVIEAGGHITNVSWDWAQNPPSSVAFYLHNETVTKLSGGPSDFPFKSQAFFQSINNVQISSPYNASANPDQIVQLPTTTNTTTATSKTPYPPAKYATLYVIGNQGLSAADQANGTGATVAEWNIVVGGS